MSYTEYLDLFQIAQQEACPYRAFMFDIIHSRELPDYSNLYFELINVFVQKIKQFEKSKNKKIFRNDENNQYSFQIRDNTKCNPMIVGDMFTIFVNENTITTKQILSLFADACRQVGFFHQFHFATCAYQTDNYAEGNTKLYKGYVPPILENISKSNGVVVDCCCIKNSEGAEKV